MKTKTLHTRPDDQAGCFQTAGPLRRFANSVERWITGQSNESSEPAETLLPSHFENEELYYRQAAKLLFPKKRILLVEDDPACCETVKAMLERWGMVVCTARTVKEVEFYLPTFEGCHFAVLDYSLPDGTGDELAKSLRAAESTQSSKLISLSGNRFMAKSSLYDASLEKPLSPQALRRTMVDLLVSP